MDDIETRIAGALREVSQEAPTIDEIVIPERKSGGPALWIMAAAAAVAAVLVPLAIITQAGRGPQPSTGVVMTTPATIQPTNPGTVGTSPYLRTCRAGQLTGRISVLDAGMDQFYNYIYLTNTGEPCQLRGIPNVVASWHRSTTTSDQGGAARLSPVPMSSDLPFSPRPADLMAPRATAVVLLVASPAGCSSAGTLGRRPAYTKLTLSFPDGPKHVVATIDPQQSAAGVEQIAIACDMEITAVSLKTW